MNQTNPKSKHLQSILAGKIASGMNFNEKVWAVTTRVPKGKVATYGQVAKALKTKAYRAVGAALGRNPFAPEVPCHRIVGTNRTLTGFAGGLPMKAKLLASEGVKIEGGKVDSAFVLKSL